MKTVLQINSLEALNKLIEGDEKLELEIRSNVANSLIKKSLKGIINNDIVRREAEILRQELNKELFKQPNWGYSAGLTPKVEELVKELVERKISSMITDIVNVKVDEFMKSGRAEEIIETKTAYLTESIVDALISKRIKEKLNI